MSIRKGDRYYWISSIDKTAIVSKFATEGNGKRNVKYFSTKKAAQAYIDMHKVLFTTEDGIAIYEGNTYWCVNTAPHLWSLFEQTAKERTQLNKTVRAFSTLEKATEFRSMNQPNLSLMDIRNAIETEGLLDEHTLLKIVESRQSKLNE